MITGEINDETLAAILWIAAQTEVFTVCGSRYFGDARIDSDFDFVLEESRANEGALLSAGFREHWDDEKKGYADTNTKTVFERGAVHIIICFSLARRIAAREHIKTHGLNRKDSSTWDDFYNQNPT
jgi:hypothetical protein